MNTGILKWSAEAPANIALIKYMGKVDFDTNVPTNPSLSYSLEHLRTRVVIETGSEGSDVWQPLNESGWNAPQLSFSSQERFLRHWAYLKKLWGLEGHFCLKSANNFPSDCGLASSASSFAALTMAAGQVAAQLKALDLTSSSLAQLSRQGSGSSCRSFFSPWALWDEAGAREVHLAYPHLKHFVAVVDDHKKDVSSSEAHRRVSSSLLFNNRPARARERCQALLRALGLVDRSSWHEAFEIVWAEFWDMHALFETSRPSFGYMTDGSLWVVALIRDLWRNSGDGPLVTMDAGPNVHVLFREDQINAVRDLAKTIGSKVRLYGF